MFDNLSKQRNYGQKFPENYKEGNYLLTKMCSKDSVGPALVDHYPEVGSVPLPHVHHPRDLDLGQLEWNLHRKLLVIVLDPLVVSDVSALTRSLYSLELLAHICVCPPVTEVIQTVGRTTKYSTLNQPNTDHGSCSAFSSYKIFT